MDVELANNTFFLIFISYGSQRRYNIINHVKNTVDVGIVISYYCYYLLHRKDMGL